MSDWHTIQHDTGALSIDFTHELDVIVKKEESGTEYAHTCESSPTQVGSKLESERIKSNSQHSRRVYTILTDLIIFKSVEMIGQRWRDIARNLGDGFTDDMIRNRFHRICRLSQQHRTDTPDGSKVSTVRRTNDTPIKATRWTAGDDRHLLMQVEIYRGANRVPWNHIKFTLSKKRSISAIRNRVYRLGIR
jgi:hypothetical protein